MDFPFKITNTNTYPNTNKNTDFTNTKFLDFPFQNHDYKHKSYPKHKHKFHKHKSHIFPFKITNTNTKISDL